jgi:glutaryl-CoA dehydrogenase
MSKDRYQYHDYYLMDELLTDEHRLVQTSVRDWVKKEVSPIVEEACQKAEFQNSGSRF